MNRVFVIVAAFACFAATCAWSQTRSEVFQLQGPRGPVAAGVAQRRVDLTFRSGRSTPGAVVVVYEPTTGLFWWNYEEIDPQATTGIIQYLRQLSALYLASDRLVSFSTSQSRELDVRESMERATSLKAALDSAVATVVKSRDVIARGPISWFTVVDLSSLGVDFFMQPGTSAIIHSPRIVRVTFAPGRWEVVIEGWSRQRAIVTLDESYKMLGTRGGSVPRP